MPRTKAPKKVLQDTMNITSNAGSDSFQGKDINEVLKEVDVMTSASISKLKDLRDSHLNDLQQAVEVLLTKLNKNILNLTIGEYIASISNKGSSLISSCIKNPTVSVSKPALGGNIQKTGTASKRSRQRQRSSSCSSNLSARTGTVKKLRKRSISADSASKFKTPTHQSIPNFPMVTPKVNPNMPMSILRRPNQGECALSLAGSPLMVTQVCSDVMASITVPLPDGRFISILPNEGIDGASLYLDDELKQQLAKLKGNLEKCLR